MFGNVLKKWMELQGIGIDDTSFQTEVKINSSVGYHSGIRIGFAPTIKEYLPARIRELKYSTRPTDHVLSRVKIINRFGSSAHTFELQGGVENLEKFGSELSAFLSHQVSDHIFDVSVFRQDEWTKYNSIRISQSTVYPDSWDIDFNITSQHLRGIGSDEK